MSDASALDFLERARMAYVNANPKRAAEIDEAFANFDPTSEVVEVAPAAPCGPEPAATSEQISFLEAQEARDEAIARVDEHSDPELKISYQRIISRLAHARAEFTSDAVEALAEAEGLPEPHEKRVLGPWILGMAKRGIIERTDRTVLSVRKSNHRRPIRVWRSLVHDDTDDGA